MTESSGKRAPSRPVWVQGEIDGQRAVPDTGVEPWVTRLNPPHPYHIAKAAGALMTVTATLRHAYMSAYQLDDAGLLVRDEPGGTHCD